MALFGFLFAAILTAGDPVPSAPPPSDWAFAKELAEMPAKLPPRVGEGRVPWAKDRISRCFFSPIKRPPFNRDELLDDVDYYPDGYLARLANEGVNGLWLTVRFRELVTCPYFPADPQAPRRLAKLRRTVAACAKHGIKVWLFAIEPTSMADDDPFLKAHPEIAGTRSWDGRLVSCLSAPATLDYLRAATRDIFTRVPGLGGLIQITSGERPTTCFSELTPNASAIGCPRCRARTPAELHAALTGALVAGMRDAGSDARMISWFYHPQKRPERAPWVAECARNLPDGVTLQYNFESGATREQVGKTRRGGDYWLSVPGPAEPFRTVAAAARSAGRSLGAKIQVSCSHEVATVPYVPVPGLLYRKYRAMRAEGVESVMQCWFFGNCPGVMNRAAGELSFSDFSEDEDAFLLRLARAEWGEDAAAVSRLWKRFSDGYAQYPLSNLLQYYGPFHASVMATLLPDVSLVSQARTWKPNETPSGDLIGEALMDFTLEDALAQTELMCAPLEDPAVDAALAELGRKYAGDRDRRRDLGVMKALKILFVGARDVFAYYLARREGLFASRERGDAQAALAETAKMRTILARADRMTGEMKSLCADDSRLGFHSEAEAHLFTVEMLDWRLRALARSRQRLDAIERELRAGRPWPLSDRERETDVWQATRTATGEIVIEGTAPAVGGDMEVRTYDLCGTCFAQVATGKADEKGHFRILLPKPSDDPRFRPAWIVIRRGGDFNNGGTKWIWPKRSEFPEPRLEQSRLTGDNFARLQVKGAETAESPLADLSFDVPKVKPCKELSADGLKGLWIESEKWKGRPTHVFAYLALPEGASASNRVPGIVLAHGGGGTAYPNWARTWANKGYAAIVVDTCGYLPISKPTEGRVLSGVGGPAGWGRFELGLEKPCDQWPYHAVAALVRAHSYLRSLPEVDAEKTGLTGISWGGYLTMLAAATDRRYKFAMPVYACADFAAIDRECPFFTASRKLAKSGALERWDELFDAKHYAPKMDLPVFWFASSNDAAFPFDLLQRTVRMPKAMPGLAVRVNMRHSHGPHGENMPELFRFADSVVRGAPELPRVAEPVVRDGGIAVAFDPKGWEIARVDLNWCKDEVPAKGSVWQAERHPAPKGDRFEAAVPADAKWLYVNVVLKGETGEKVYPESLVSSPAVRL